MTAKILHFLPDNHAWGGVEIYLARTLPALRKRGRYTATAVVTEGGMLHKTLEQAGVPVRTVSSHWRFPPLLKNFDPRLYAELLPILQDEAPDLVHLHVGRVEHSVIGMAGYPMVYSYHGYGGANIMGERPSLPHWLLAKTSQLFFRGLIPCLKSMVVVSDFERQRLLREGFLPPDFPARVLYNGLSIDAFLKPLADFDRDVYREKLGIPAKSHVVSFICRLDPDKNSLAFLSIARNVLRQWQSSEFPLYFLVAGDGVNASVFRKAFESDPDLAGHGQYLGFREDVPQLISVSDVTLSTSLQEGFGLRILESLACGVPCVAYAAGGIPEVMNHPVCQPWLVPVGDEFAFVQSVIQVLQNTDQARFEAANLEEHVRGFSEEGHLEQLEQFYDSVVLNAEPAGPTPLSSITPATLRRCQ